MPLQCFFKCKSIKQASWWSHLQSVIINCNLYTWFICHQSMTMRIDDHLANSLYRKLINFFSLNTFYFSAKAYVTKYKAYCFIYLFIKRSFIFTFIQKYRAIYSLEDRALRFWKLEVFRSQKYKRIWSKISIIILLQNLPVFKFCPCHIWNRFSLILLCIDCFPPIIHILTKLLYCIFSNCISNTCKFIPRNLCPLHLKLFYFIRRSDSRCASDTDIGSIHFSFCLKIIWSMRPRWNGYQNNRLPCYSIGFNFWNDLWLTGIRHSICYAVHCLKQNSFLYAYYFMRFINNSENYFATLRICKRDNRLDILFWFFRKFFLELYILRFSPNNLFNRHKHLSPLYLYFSSYIPLAGILMSTLHSGCLVFPAVL